MASLLGAADGQGLAGGAIVLGYGLMTGLGALFVGIAVVYWLERRNIILFNKVLAVLLLLFVGLLFFRNLRRGAQSGPEDPRFLPSQPTPEAGITQI
ncbi:hypothetical protein GCM10028791_17520 [Echinicola sediminis]